MVWPFCFSEDTVVWGAVSHSEAPYLRQTLLPFTNCKPPLIVVPCLVPIFFASCSAFVPIILRLFLSVSVRSAYRALHAFPFPRGFGLFGFHVRPLAFFPNIPSFALVTPTRAGSVCVTPRPPPAGLRRPGFLESTAQAFGKMLAAFISLIPWPLNTLFCTETVC